VISPFVPMKLQQKSRGKYSIVSPWLRFHWLK
jgi:hypothetical protein